MEVYINLSYKYRDNFVDGYKAKMLKADLTNLINVIIKHGHTGGGSKSPGNAYKENVDDFY